MNGMLRREARSAFRGEVERLAALMGREVCMGITAGRVLDLLDAVDHLDGVSSDAGTMPRIHSVLPVARNDSSTRVLELVADEGVD